MDINTCTDAYTHSNQGVGPEVGMTATHTGAPMFPCNYAKGVEQTWGVRWILIHVLMHVHMLKKEWGYKWVDWNTHTGTQVCM